MPPTSTRPITGLTGGRRATFADYSELFTTDMRPAKFSEKEAGLQMADRGMPTCSECRHWFLNPVTKHTVCEVVRRHNELNISGQATCMFQNLDGVHYPLLEVLG